MTKHIRTVALILAVAGWALDAYSLDTQNLRQLTR